MGLGIENHNVDITETITHLSLCSGYDGIGLGLRRVWPNVRDVAHVEIEAFAAANLVAKMEAGELDSAPVWTNLKTFPAWRFRGCVDILSAGFPCQPFSCAGARAADGDPRHLWPYVRQAVGLIRPRMVIFENVQGIISTKLKGRDWNDPEGTPVLLHVLRELERTGYKCTWGVFSASEVGAPHQRKRVFILGDSASEGLECSRTQGEVGSESEATSEKGSEFASPFEHAMPPHYGGATRWPAHPGEEQYEWEEPRVVADSKSERLHGGETKVEQKMRECIEQGNEIWSMHKSSSCSTGKIEPRVTEAQPELGGATNGTTSRVDRLRLLGNGVVPQTAERAVRVLLQKLLS